MTGGNGEDEDEEDALTPFECGVCSGKFSTVEKLEMHVLKKHEAEEKGGQPSSNGQTQTKGKTPPSGQPSTPAGKPASNGVSAAVIDEVADEFAGEVAAFEAAEENARKKMEGRKALKNTPPNVKGVSSMPKPNGVKMAVPGPRPTERNWQECPDRNWAAVFGYGKSENQIPILQSSVVKPSPSAVKNASSSGGQGKTRSGAAASKPSAPTLVSAVKGDDLLSKMRSLFRTGSDDSEDNEGLEDADGNPMGDSVYRSRGLKGTVKASPGKAPRTLSTSSLKTRQRMEALMRRAREFMRTQVRSYFKCFMTFLLLTQINYGCFDFFV